jgi:hypothetical protein
VGSDGQPPGITRWRFHAPGPDSRSRWKIPSLVDASRTRKRTRDCGTRHVLINEAELEQLRAEAHRANQVVNHLLFTLRFNDLCARGVRGEEERELWRGVVLQPPQASRHRFGGLPFRAEIVEDEAERQRLWNLAERVVSRPGRLDGSSRSCS